MTTRLKDIKERVEANESFVNWLVETWRSKNWVRALLLVDFLIFVFLNPFVLNTAAQYTRIPAPSWYNTPVWGTLVGLIFIIAFVVALRTKPTYKQTAPPERSAIKGLRPFLFTDADIFTSLKRDAILRECLAGITDKEFRFGILCGESGCGKSSFLQAGLWPVLLKRSHRCIYIKFTDLNPLESVRQALLEHTRLYTEETETGEVLELLNKAGKLNAEPVVLLFDQFEQFFVHHKRRTERETFVQLMADWYKARPTSPVKILICLRGDFSDRLIELQKAMGYSLGPQESFRLEKFEPEQATEVFRVIAETEGIDFDEEFIKEIARVELANREDGLVSPVDVQILAWMIAGQPAEVRAFNRSTYQKLGGVEGLLERFLNRTLSVRETELRRQTAIKVLLALTDRERNTRAGALNLEEIKSRLGGTVAPTEVDESVEWLARSDVRLITPTDRDGIQVYELAHERIIPALLRLAGQALTGQDQANQLLNRRVNEWLGNKRARRFLLSWRELRLIGKHWPYLVWGEQSEQKQELIAKSKYNRNLVLGIPSAFLLLAVVLYSLWATPWGQAWQMNRDLQSLSRNINGIALRPIAISYAAAQDFDQVQQILDRIDEPSEKANVLAGVAAAYMKIGQGQRALETFRQAVDEAGRVNDPADKARILISIAAKYGENGEEAKDAAILEQVVEIAAKVDDLNARIDILRNVTDVASRIVDEAKTIEVFARVVELTKKIEDSRLKANALLSIINSYARGSSENKDSGTLFQTLETAKDIADVQANVPLLTAIADAYARIGDSSKALEMLAQIAEERRQPNDYAVYVLCDIADTYNNLGNRAKAMETLARALKLSEKVGVTHYRVYAFNGIAEIYGRIGDSSAALKSLSKAIEISETVQDTANKIYSYNDIAKTYSRLGDKAKAMETLARSLKIIETVAGPVDRIYTYNSIANTYSKIGEDSKAIEHLAKSIRILGTIPISDNKRDASEDIAKIYRKIIEANKDARILAQAVEATALIENPRFKFDLVSSAVNAYMRLGQETKDAGLINQALEVASRIDDTRYKNGVLSMIVSTYIQMGKEAKDAGMLALAAKTAARIEEIQYRVSILTSIADAYAQIGDSRKALETLAQVADATGKLPNKNAWSAIAEVYAKVGYWRQARQATQQTGLNSENQAFVLSKILIVWAARKNPALAKLEAAQLL